MEFEKLQEIIADVMNVTKDDVQPETKFVEDLSADQLDILQIITELEEAFDIEIDNEDADKIVTVQDAVDQIKKVVEQSSKQEKALCGLFRCLEKCSEALGTFLRNIFHRKELLERKR